MQPGASVEVELRWTEPDTRLVRAYRNAVQATENGACALALGAAELRVGLVTIGQALAESGGDYYLVPAGAEATDDPDLNLDRDDVVLFEVSGIDLDDEAKMTRRLREKIEQVRAQGWSKPAMAGVVGFLNGRIWLKEA